jgi:predicted NUDIX family NTP pyrophosphohydrolase
MVFAVTFRAKSDAIGHVLLLETILAEARPNRCEVEEALAMSKRSAGVLLYRYRGETLEVLLVHPGGPFWAKKDLGVWSIPKGEIDAGEDEEEAARREFEEETGFLLERKLFPIGVFKQPSGKLVSAFSCEGDADLTRFRSNSFEVEWPPKSGKHLNIQEADRAEWFVPEEALRRIVGGQRPIVEALAERLAVKGRHQE